MATFLIHRAYTAEDFERFRQQYSLHEIEQMIELQGAFGPGAQAAAKAWVAKQHRDEADRKDLIRLELERRAVAASEASAAAAASSAKWAKLAVLISLGALFLSAWPFFAWVRA